LTAFLVKRALPMRSVTTGLLWGIGCGLVGDAGLRLYCDFTTLPHLVLEHFAAILFAAIAGAVITPATSHVDQNRARPAARDRRQG
jgi:hypothetical protein